MYLCDTLDDFSFAKTSIIENGRISRTLYIENISIIVPKLKYWMSSMRATQPVTSGHENAVEERRSLDPFDIN